ncbi:hypothetical protein ACFE04_002133 [Oxalis oulophora]
MATTATNSVLGRSSRRWCRKEGGAIIIGVGFTVILYYTLTHSDSPLIDPQQQQQHVSDDLVNLTLLHTAKDKGAFCLDGSLPAYHFQKGFGSACNNWLIHIEGGGWCNTIESCSLRATTPLGSSKYMDTQVHFSGILSSDPSQNPDFFNWNRVKMRYCDGASFAGRPESEPKNGVKLFFRGQLIWEAFMAELFSIGLSNAKQAFLTGCSAGGLATLIHCDDFREHFPKDITVKCLADAGFFLDEADVVRSRTMRSFYRDVVNLQGVAQSLNKNCVKSMEPSQCLFPRQIVKDLKTPVFIAQPAYDFWQIQNILIPNGADPQRKWRKCRLNLRSCSPSQMEVLQGYRDSMLKILNEFQQKKETGLFVNSCFIHCQTWISLTWHSPTSPKVNNKTLAESVSDWYFDRKVAKHIDCPYPCNPTCYNMDFTRH